ncbi:MAG: hypothetical protein ABIP74_03525 [Candidatus Saccharimonas sp.]
MEALHNQPQHGHGGEDPRRAFDEQIKDDIDGPARRYIEVTDESSNDDIEVSEARRGYGGEDGQRASDDQIRDDVEGVAQRAIEGPRRVEEGEVPQEDVRMPQRGYGGEDGKYAADEPMRDDVEGAATRAAAGPRRVEEGEPTDKTNETHDDNEAAVEELADAIESGEVTEDEAAQKIAELMKQNVDLKEKVKSLEEQVATLMERLEKLDQMTDGATAEDEGATEQPEGENKGESKEVKSDGSPEAVAFTTEDQEALKKKLAEEDALAQEKGGDREDDTTQHETENTQERPPTAELQATRDRYAKLTAGDRLNYLGRIMKSNGPLSRAVKKIPGVEGLLDRLNNTSRSQVVEEARAEYEAALRALEVYGVQAAEDGNHTLEQIEQGRMLMQIREEHALTKAVHDYQMAAGKDHSKFSDWWVRNNGLGGKILKAGVVVGATLATGGAAGAIAAGFFGVAAAAGLAGAGVGALTGGGIAKHVTDRRARSFIDKERTRTVAEREMRQDRASMEAEREGGSEPRRAVENEAIPLSEVREPRRAIGPDWVGRVTNVVEARTNEIVKNNRMRMKAAVGLGAAAGGFAGAHVGDAVNAAMNSGGEHNIIDNPHPDEGTPPDQRYDQMLKGHEFKVESGHSVIKEIQQAAHANGHDISMNRAEDIYNHIYHNVGDKIIHGGPEYHGPTGDIRFGESGTYAWGKGILQQIVNMSGK